MKDRRKITALILCAALCGCGSAPAGIGTQAAETTAASVSVPEETAYEAAAEGEAFRWEGELPAMDGSTSAAPLEIGLKAELLGIPYSEAKKIVSHTTTHQSFTRLLEGEVDMIFSVPISDEQQKAADEAGVTLTMIPVAKEGFVFTVNAENPVDTLTSEQIRGIYSGEITNWAQAGGNDGEIIAYQRNIDSGSQNYMTRFMGDTALIEPEKKYVTGAMGSMMDAIAAYDNSESAIGYSVYSYAAQMYENARKVKFIAVDGVKPTKAAMADGSYPLSSVTYIIYTDKAGENVKKFADWAVSDEGQLAVLNSGYLPVNGMEIPESALPYDAVGTGKPRRGDYEPDRYYSTLSIKYEKRGIEDDYFELNCFSDKEFEARINADIRGAMDELRAGGEKYPFNPGSMYLRTSDGIYMETVCNNGYLSITLGYIDEDVEIICGLGPFEFMVYSKAVTLNYDIIEQKKIEKFSDFFYEGTDFTPLLNNAMADYCEMYYATEVKDTRKADFSGILGEPRLFTIESVGLEPGNPYFQAAPMLYFTTDDNIYDLALFGEYRDMKDALDDDPGQLIDVKYKEWENGFFKERGLEIETAIGSRYHTDEEIKAYSDEIVVAQRAGREFMEKVCGFDFESDDNYVRRIRYRKSKALWHFDIGTASAPVTFDAETMRPLTPDMLFKEGWESFVPDYKEEREYYVGYFSLIEDRTKNYVLLIYPENENTESRQESAGTAFFEVPYEQFNEKYVYED